MSALTNAHLADHAPAGTPVLPLAVALEWFARLSGSGDVELRDVRVLRRVDLPDLATGHRLTIDRDGPDLHLRSPVGTHYRASLATPDSHHTWTDLTDTTSVGDVYESPVLFHGPRFHSLQEIGYCTEGADAHVVGVRQLGWTDGPWWTDPAAVDGALQAAVLWADRTVGDATLPMGVDRFRVHRAGPAPAPLRCLVRADTVADGQTRCDITLLDPDGEPRIELRGVSLIRRPDMAVRV